MLAFSGELGSGAVSVVAAPRDVPPGPSWRPSGGMTLALSLSYRLDPSGAGCWKKLAGLPWVLAIGKVSVWIWPAPTADATIKQKEQEGSSQI